MRRQAHPDTETLIAYAEAPDASGAAPVREHLAAGCAECLREVAEWRRLLGALEADRAPGPPEQAVRAVLSLIDTIEPAPSTLQRLIGMLVFDSRMRPAMAGVRDAGSGSFKLLYEAEGVSVDLLCEPDGGCWTLTGQVLGERAAPGPWRIQARVPGAEASSASGETDALGGFSLAGLLAGRVELSFRSAGREIVLPEVDLTADTDEPRRG